MNLNYDILLAVSLKLILLIGFIAGIKFWIKKNINKNNGPMIIYWIFGILFVFSFSAQIIRWLFSSFSYPTDSILSDETSIGVASTLIGFGFFLLIGLKYLKRGKNY